MTREEAAKRWEWVIENFNYFSVYLWPDQRQELLASIALLRGPVPDPETGLVSCGCGKRLVLKHNPGKCQEPYDNPSDPENWDFPPSWWVECEKSSLSIGKRYNDTFSEYCGVYDSAEEAITEANRAMGYKEDA